MKNSALWSGAALLLFAPLTAQAQRRDFNNVSARRAQMAAVRSAAVAGSNFFYPHLNDHPRAYPAWEYLYHYPYWNPAIYPYGALPYGGYYPALSGYGYRSYYPAAVAPASSYSLASPGYTPAYGTGYYPANIPATFGPSPYAYAPSDLPASSAVADPYGAGIGSPTVAGYSPSTAAPTPSANVATITVKVPFALTEVLLNGTATEGTGKTRTITTGDLSPGKVYTLTLQANWSEAGMPRSRTRQIRVAGGQQAMVDFTTGRD